MRLHATLLAAGLTLAGASSVAAQPPVPPSGPVQRMDAAAMLGWLSAQTFVDPYDDWRNSLQGAATFGLYWTDHLKTEVETAISANATHRAFTYGPYEGRPTPIESTFDVSTRRVGLGQQYQFFRNRMFHPYVAAGVDLTWEKTKRQDVFYGTSGVSTTNAATTDTELITRPFTSLGFKAYVSPTAFFRSDLKVTYRSGVDEVLVRFGFGMDF